MASSLPARIDVHSHFLPPFYRDAMQKTGHSHPDGMPAIPEWSPESHLEMMAAANITKSILSISSPGTNLDVSNNTLSINMTRRCNQYASTLKKSQPDKFGYWASLPLPDVEATLSEIEKCVEEGADGFGLMTNYHGYYAGDATFDSVFDKLNELGATVFIHPTTPCMKHGSWTPMGGPQTTPALPLGEEYPVPVFEFFFDTARAMVHLFSSGTIDRCPNIKFVIPHAGGALPPVMTRFILFSSAVPGGRVLDPVVVRQQLEAQFYYDLAGFVFDGQASGNGQLKAFVDGFDISHTRLLYGSDFPFTRLSFVKVLAERMKSGLGDLFDEQQRYDIYAGNAERLLGQDFG